MYLLTAADRSTRYRSSSRCPARTSAAIVFPVPLGPVNRAVIPRPRLTRSAKPHRSCTVARWVTWSAICRSSAFSCSGSTRSSQPTRESSRCARAPRRGRVRTRQPCQARRGSVPAATATSWIAERSSVNWPASRSAAVGGKTSPQAVARSAAGGGAMSTGAVGTGRSARASRVATKQGPPLRSRNRATGPADSSGSLSASR